MTLEIFADSLGIATSPRAVRIILKDDTDRQVTKAVIVLPPVVAKELALLLRKHLKDHERRDDTIIQVPDAFWPRVGIAQEDW